MNRDLIFIVCPSDRGLESLETLKELVKAFTFHKLKDKTVCGSYIVYIFSGD